MSVDERLAIMRRLGIPEKSSVGGTGWQDPRGMVPLRRDAATIRRDRAIPFFLRHNYRVRLTSAERTESARRILDLISTPTIRLADEATQSRVQRIHDDLVHRIGRRELSGRGLLSGRVAVLQGQFVFGGRPMNPLNAWTLDNGAIIFTRNFVDLADRVGLALAASRNSREMLVRIGQAVDDKLVVPAGTDPALAKSYADAFLTFAVGHELGHRAQLHGSVGRPHPFTRPATPTSRRKEHLVDAAGVELATRAGSSLLGQSAAAIVMTLFRARTGKIDPSPRTDTHPTGLNRYTALREYMFSLENKSRLLYDGRTPGRPGVRYLTPGMQQELARLPTSQELRTFAVEYKEAHAGDSGQPPPWVNF